MLPDRQTWQPVCKRQPQMIRLCLCLLLWPQATRSLRIQEGIGTWLHKLPGIKIPNPAYSNLTLHVTG